MIGHPGERRLLGFHEGRLPDGERRRIAAHLADCQRCRNMIQGHRAVRQVFQLEAPPAPGGVLERVLATRAGGGVMVLPVADPGDRRRVRGSAIALLAGAAAVALLSAVQVIPMRPFAAAWETWSEWVVDWRPFGGSDGGGIDLPMMLESPIAAPAVLYPERLRPMTMTYRSVDMQGTERQPHIDTTVISIVAPTDGAGDWELRSFKRGDPDPTYIRKLDPRTLAPHSWGSANNPALDARAIEQGLWRARRQITLVGDTLSFTLDYLGIAPDQMLQRQPAGSRRNVLTRVVPAPYYYGLDHLMILMQTTELHGSWAGSFTGIRVYDTGEPWVNTVTLYVVGSEVVSTPAGTFDSWSVRMLDPYRESPFRFWFRKSDGLLVRRATVYPREVAYGSHEELLSVTYP